MTDITKSEHLAILLHRQGKEPSKALPQGAYRNPAESIEYDRERAERERARVRRNTRRKDRE